MPLTEVRQSTFAPFGENMPAVLATAKMGLLATLSKWDLLALGGKMFTLGEATIGTPVIASAVDAAGIVLTAPTIRFTVPSGITVFPRRLNLAYEAMAGTLNEIAIIANAANSYTSGGTAITPLNMRVESTASATSVTNCYYAAGSNVVEAGLTNPRHLYKHNRAAAFTAGETFENVNIVFDDLIPVVGPASFLVYVGSAGTAPTFTFALQWGELPTSVVF